MSTRQFDTAAASKVQPVSPRPVPVAESAPPEPASRGLLPHAGLGAAAPPAPAQAVALSRSSGGHLARAGDALLQLQRLHGNRYVQEVLGYTRGRARQEAPPVTAPVVQTKLRVGPADDRYEREADRVARQVVAHTSTSPEQPPSRATQRPAENNDTGLRCQPAIQRLHGAVGGAVNAGVQQAIQQGRRRGQCLPDAVRVPLEQAFGADFSSVRVHTDGQADQLNRALQARAFTTGQDIFFAQGAYSPRSREGQATLAHELTHVMQQRTPSGSAAPQPASAAQVGIVQRAPTQESMENAWSEMSTRVEGLAIVDFIERVRRAGKNGVYDGKISAGFTWSDFRAVLGTAQGKRFVTGKWRDTANKQWGENQLVQGQHEWIETATLDYVISKANKGQNLDGWLMALDMLRIPTKEVIFPPQTVRGEDFSEAIASANENPNQFTASSLKIFSGHPGAMYGERPPGGPARKPKDKYRQLTTYSGTFHSQLKALLKKHLNDETDDLAGFMNDLIEFQENQLWGGDIPGLDKEKAQLIVNDLRASKTADAELLGVSSIVLGPGQKVESRVTPFGNVAEMQDFAKEAKQRNTEIMTHRVNAITRHGSPTDFSSGYSYWSSLPKEPVYVTDESGKQVDDYMHVEDMDDEEQQEKYSVATLEPSSRPASAPQPQRFPQEVIDQYGVARSTAQINYDRRIAQINAEIQQQFTNSYKADVQELQKSHLVVQKLPNEHPKKQMLQRQIELNSKAIDKVYLAYRAAVVSWQNDYAKARQQLDIKLYAEETRQTTVPQLKALLEGYDTEINRLMDHYVARVRELLKPS